jgi:hypothetical protein
MPHLYSVPDNNHMDNNLIIPLVVIIILIIGGKVIMSKVKKAKDNQIIVNKGTQFEARIIGVAHPRTILNIEGQPNTTVTMLGTEFTDISTAARHERYHRVRVKIEYTDPFTRQTKIVHRVLNETEYTDDRIVKVGNPGQLTLSAKSIEYMKHNKKLYTEYVKGLESRNLSKEEKKQLMQEAALAMNNQNDQMMKDSEGYNILNPPVIAEGYELNGELHFNQTTNTPIFQDWTKGLK